MIDLNEDRRNCYSCVVGITIYSLECVFCRNCDKYISDKKHDEFGWEIEQQSEHEINEALCDMDVMGNIDCNTCRYTDFANCDDPVTLSAEFCFADCSVDNCYCSRDTCYCAWLPSNRLS